MIRNVIFLFVVLAVVFVVYLPSFMQMQDLWNRNQVFERRIKDLEASNVKLSEERDKLINDPEYFEKVARERMGLIKEGEVIYKVVPQGSKKDDPVEEVKKPAAAPVAKKASAKKEAALKSAKTAIKAKTAVKSTAKTKATTSTKAKSVKVTTNSTDSKSDKD